jgi:Spy/CpxP family protein refolding chaperone
MTTPSISRKLFVCGVAVAVLGSAFAISQAQAHDRMMGGREGSREGGGMMHAAMGRHGGHGGEGAMMGLFGGRGLERMLDSVNATADQRRQIQGIAEAARQEMGDPRQDRMALRQEMMALFAQPTVDARALEALRARMLAQHDSASKRSTQVMLDISRVLTPEQRQGLVERMKQRQEHRSEHRGRRHGMPPGAEGAAPGANRP